MARQTTAEWKAQRTAEREKIAVDDVASEIWRISAEPTPNAYSTGLDAGLAVPRIGMTGFHTCCAEVVTVMDGDIDLHGKERARRIVAAMNFLRDIPTKAFDGVLLKPFAELIHESFATGTIAAAKGNLSSPTRRVLDGLRGAAPATARDTRQPQLDPTTPRGIAITQAIGRAPPPPTPLLDIARADTSRKFTIAERDDALRELHLLRQLAEPAKMVGMPTLAISGSIFQRDFAIAWGEPGDANWIEPTIVHSTVRDALVAELNAIDRLRRAQSDR